LLNGGRVVEGEVTESGDSVTIQLRFGPYTVKRKAVKDITYEGGQAAAPGAKKPKAVSPVGAPAGDTKSYVDYDGRFVVDAPEGWSLLPRSTHPAARAMLKHDSLDAWVYFSVAPYPDAYPDPDGKGREKLAGIAKRARVSAGALFEESLSFNFKKGWLFETPVWEAQYTFGRGERKTVLEYRVGRGGMEYTIRAGCPATNFKAWLPTLKAACEAFSMGLMDVTGTRRSTTSSAGHGAPRVLAAVRGSGSIDSVAGRFPLSLGDVVLLPAALGDFQIHSHSGAPLRLIDMRGPTPA